MGRGGGGGGRFTGLLARAWPSTPLGNIAQMFYSLLCASFTIKSSDNGQDFCFYLKMNHKAAGKHWSKVS